LLTRVNPSLQKTCGSDVALLEEWTLQWDNAKRIIRGLKYLFSYLERSHIPRYGLRFLEAQGFLLYKENTFDTFKNFARVAILNSIEKERNNERQDRRLLHKSVQVFVEIDRFEYQNFIYKELEEFVIQHARTFYKRQSRTWMDQNSCPTYLKQAENMLQSERDLANCYLDSTVERLQEECYVQFLRVHQTELLQKQKGLGALIATDAREDLSRLFRLYKNYPKDIQPLVCLFEKHIEQDALSLMIQKENDEKLIDLHMRYQIDAVIVRIMKIRKTLKHSELVVEVIAQLKSRVEKINGRIAALIEQGYLETEKTDSSVYNYLA